MNTEEMKETPEPLEVVACRIQEHAEESDDHVVAAAKLLRELRQRIEDGEAGEITWPEWVEANINLSKSRLHELQQIADAEDPKAKLEQLRGATRERVRKHREKKANARREMEDDRRELIAWAKKAPIDAVRDVLRRIESDGDAVSSGSEDERMGSDQQRAA